MGKAKGFKALEFKVEPSSVDKRQMILGMHATTFNRASMFGNVPSVKGMARYDLEGLVPVRTDRRDGTEFVNKSKDGERNLVEFLSFRPDEYSRCKVGMLNGLVRTYNSIYDGVSRIDLVSMKERKRVSPPTRKNFQTAFVNEISKRVSKRDIYLIDLENDTEITVNLRGLSVRKVSGEMLTSANVTDFNSFEQPDRVRPVPFKGAEIDKDVLRVKLPAKSIVTLELK